MIPVLLNMKIDTIFNRNETSQNLSELCMKLLSEQQKTWSDLGLGYEALNSIRTREILCNGFSVRVQQNSGRVRSTLADVREKSINERRCFLCPGNLPADQKGVLYQKEYLILCNPMPVFPGHFTIAHLTHQPQAIAENIDSLLQLMDDFGSRWSILYNGPKCGASAPDHLHFQAIPSGKMPIEKEIMEEKKLIELTRIDNVVVSRAKGLGREILVLEADELTGIATAFKQTVTALRRAADGNDEPMMNLAGFHDGKHWRLMVFPRAKHRPEAFFRQGADRVTVSPAVIEMGGVLVTPLEKDFQCLDTSVVEGIFREVSLFLP